MEAGFSTPTVESERKLLNKLLSNGSLQMPKYCHRCNSNIYLKRQDTFYDFFLKLLFQL